MMNNERSGLKHSLRFLLRVLRPDRREFRGHPVSLIAIVVSASPATTLAAYHQKGTHYAFLWASNALSILMGLDSAVQMTKKTLQREKFQFRTYVYR